jgi:hypothetical protein
MSNDWDPSEHGFNEWVVSYRDGEYNQYGGAANGRNPILPPACH